ncbi:MAG TPA: aldehyde dehydrogenase [Pseudomonadota bacterium]|jgi:aminomuconate-semialdehyde/2-hydroxymuconate-6-semialdehyde dehydrogenase|nr:aldehyde dehydrogenase [Pseudomonadota bacterium]
MKRIAYSELNAVEHWLDVVDPATTEVFAQVSAGTAHDVDVAVRRAQAAFPVWSKLPNSERARWLERLADALEARIPEFAEAETRDTGKPLWLTREIEIPRAVANLRFFAQAATQFASESHHGQAGLNYTLRQAHGVVGVISPWNMPLLLFTWKLAPALAAGNCVIAKPSEVTPLTAQMLAELARDIDFPLGVLNIVHGLGQSVGQALVDHPGIKAISFTGSTAVGRRIAESCARQLKKCSLELGGKNAALIFADAPKDRLYDHIVRAAFQNTGQICLCGSRLLIERRYYDEFRDQFVARATHHLVGDPLAEGSFLGPMVSQAHCDKVMAYLDLARAEGGRVIAGGRRIEVPGRCANGWFVAPTIVEGLGPRCRTNQEEIFGPIVTLQAFDDDDEALALANATPYGLSASIWTEHLSRAHRLAAQLDAGIVWINTWMQRDLRTPFGGMKQSGLGREGGLEAMRFFTEPKNVCIGV